MSIYNKPFPPTFLYIKKHKKTGLSYFGKCVGRSPEKYVGSGTHWKRHIAKHGKEHIENVWYCLFTCKDQIREFALNFSKINNITKSKDWANLIEENGISFYHKVRSTKGIKRGPMKEETKIKLSIINLNRGAGNPKTFAKIALANTGRKHSAESKAIRSLKAYGNINVRGKIWVNNGEINRRVLAESIPENFLIGRLLAFPVRPKSV